jgi:hypothetical protein
VTGADDQPNEPSPTGDRLILSGLVWSEDEQFTTTSTAAAVADPATTPTLSTLAFHSDDHRLAGDPWKSGGVYAK